MTKVALLGDRVTEYMPYKIDENMDNGFNVPMISSKLPNNDITFYICGTSNVGVGTYHKFLWKDVIKDGIDYFILQIGINNILSPDCDHDGKESLDDTFEKIKLFIQDIINSGNKLIVQLLYPTGKIETNYQVMKLNEKLKAFCIGNNIDYLDLYQTLIGINGILDFRYSNDGLHLNETGYKLIIEELYKKIELKKAASKKLEK